MDRVKLEKMMSGYPTVIVTDSGLSSASGLPQIEFMNEPLKPHRKIKIYNTAEAMVQKMLVMKPKELASYYSYLQKPKHLIG